MRVFVLEDDPERIRLFHEALFGADYTLATSIAEARAKFTPLEPYDYLFLDHDLGMLQFVSSDLENTGAQFCRDFATKLGKAKVVIHSFNLDGAMRMQSICDDAGVRAIRVPFGPSVLTQCRYLSAKS